MPPLIISVQKAVESLTAAMEGNGVIPGEVVLDGRIHRCGTADKPHGLNGWYIAHGDDPVSAAYGDWRTSESFKFCAKGDRELTTEERARLKARYAAEKKRRQEDEAKRQGEARVEAKRILAATMPAPSDHGYLVRKGVAPVGDIRIADDGRLVVPVLDAKGAVMSLQFIGLEGDKLFLAGGKLKGGYSPILAANGEKKGRLYVCEGYATGATIHAATGAAVLVAFNCGNLLAVAEMARAQYPDREIIICADDDAKTAGNPGLSKATEAAVAVKALLAVPRFTDPTGGTDFNDMAQASGLEAVKAALEAAEAPGATDAKTDKPGLVIFDIRDFLALDIKPREYVISPVIPCQGLVMLYAMRGIGKTHFALHLSYAVATGQMVFRWQAVTPRRVLYLDGEMPANAMQERLAGIVASYAKEPLPGFMQIITPDTQPLAMPNLATPEGQAALAPCLEGVELLVVDNLATLCRAGRENEAEGWLPVQEWILALRRRGISVLLVHHANKSGGQRGTSSREDVLDTVISLRRPQDYRPEEGARFEVHLEKARGIIGDDAKPFEAKLMQDGDAMAWACRDIEDVQLETVRQLHAEKMSIRDIAEETGIPKSTVQRMVKKLGGGVS
ncbi:DNA primase [Desulfovibrio sp. DV]|uniref:AAA family ATPase n=1 Tax=Desulfovibrio sp. DV TaxID=1844708 RepID=UPI00095C22E3|nr:AAA family ATPase [Desulfovibrio sp. DV]OLN29860.1 DNA primase [Desulfovibrio sp. DV]